jgi:DNA replication protein DnaD
VIEEACRRTVMNVEDHRFAYAESILQDWFYNGVRSMEDIAAMDEAFRKNSKQRLRRVFPQRRQPRRLRRILIMQPDVNMIIMNSKKY